MLLQLSNTIIVELADSRSAQHTLSFKGLNNKPVHWLVTVTRKGNDQTVHNIETTIDDKRGIMQAETHLEVGSKVHALSLVGPLCKGLTNTIDPIARVGWWIRLKGVEDTPMAFRWNGAPEVRSLAVQIAVEVQLSGARSLKAALDKSPAWQIAHKEWSSASAHMVLTLANEAYRSSAGV